MNAIDPTEIHDIEEAQVYEDSRSGELFELVYVDGNVYVAQDESGGHRLGKRTDFDKNVAAGRYDLCLDEPSFAHTGDGDPEPIEFEDLENIGQKGATNLRKNGFETTEDIRRASDEEILDVSWVGDGGLESLRERAQ